MNTSVLQTTPPGVNVTSNLTTRVGVNFSSNQTSTSWIVYATRTVPNGQNPFMSEGGGGISVGIIVGAGVGGCALIVGLMALVIYCYMKARKEKSNTNMTKSTDVFTTAASNTQYDYPRRSKVNQYPDPAKRRRDVGHTNAAYSRNSDSSSIGSDVEGRDLSPPRSRARGGRSNAAFSSDSSYEDSSSVDDEVVGGNSYRMERETDRQRASYKRSKQNDIIDGSKNQSNGRYRRTGEESHRMSRRDEFSKRNPRSDSPLTIETLEKHEKITRKESNEWDGQKSHRSSQRQKKRESSPSRTYESSEITQASLTTEGTVTTANSSRFVKNPSLRRQSPNRSSSQRRYRKDRETDDKGRKKPRRTRSSSRQGQGQHRSRSPGSQTGSQSSGSSRRSRSSSASEARRTNKEQAMLPIFQDLKKKSSAV